MAMYQQFLLILSLRVHTILGYANGDFSLADGRKSCEDMLPDHLANQPQTTESPFFVRVSNTTYTPGTNLKVTLDMVHLVSSTSLTGFMLQARVVSSQKLVGNFNVQRYTVKISCGTSGATVTHSMSTQHVLPLMMEWTPPEEDVGPVQFYLTAVQNYQMFWVKEISPVVQSSSTRVHTTCHSAIVGVISMWLIIGTFP